MPIEFNPPFRVDVKCFSVVPPNRRVAVEEREPETGRVCKTAIERLDGNPLILSHTDWHGGQYCGSLDLGKGMAQLDEPYLGDLRYAEISTRLFVDTCRKHLDHQELV